MGFVMSIDTGNKMMKTNHFIFHSGIKRKEQKILPGEEGIFFKGINYLESNQRISYLEDKTIDDRYYILTLLGGKEKPFIFLIKGNHTEYVMRV